MTAVGLVGGLGPESTADYYMRIVRRWQEQTPDTAPAMVIDSLDVRQALRLVASDIPALVEYLSASLRRLAAAGVDFAAITASTPHLVFDELTAASPVPLVSLVESCAVAARAQGLKRLLLLGTRFTMDASFFQTAFARHGIDVAPPGAEDRAWMHQCYVDELLVGVFTDDARERVQGIVERQRDTREIDGVILGGTELPLLMRDAEIAGLPALDTTALHIAEIVTRLRG